MKKGGETQRAVPESVPESFFFCFLFIIRLVGFMAVAAGSIGLGFTGPSLR